jgi:hypothetical protein
METGALKGESKRYTSNAAANDEYLVGSSHFRAPPCR